MKNESRLMYMTVEIREKYGNFTEWDIMQKYEIDDTHGETKFIIIDTPDSYMTKRRIIKRLVELGGERTRKRGKLIIYFDGENARESIDWIDSLKLIKKLANA